MDYRFVRDILTAPFCGTGGNVPGRKAENVMYAGGLSTYEAQCREKMDGWKGFDVVTAV